MAEFELMQQNLLAERFHLRIHHETRNFPGYDLVVAKGGPKLQEAASDPQAATGHGTGRKPPVKKRAFCFPAGPRMSAEGAGRLRIQSQEQPISQLATFLLPLIVQALGTNTADLGKSQPAPPRAASQALAAITSARGDYGKSRKHSRSGLPHGHYGARCKSSLAPSAVRVYPAILDSDDYHW